MRMAKVRQAVNDLIQLNIVSPQFKANPFPVLANLRASQPVFRTALPDKTPVWLLTRYEDVATLLKDDRFVKDKRKAMTAEQLRKMPLRTLVHKAFTPNLVARMRDRIQALADELLTQVMHRGE